MRQSASGTVSGACGFSLVEMLVVLLIAGLLAGTVSLSLGSLPGTARDTGSAAEQLYSTLRGARELAVLGGRPVGLMLDPSEDGGGQYSVAQYREQVWHRVDGASGGGGQMIGRLPEGVRLALDVESELLSGERIRALHAEQQPVLVFLPTGEWPVFSIRLSGEGSAENVVRANERGELIVQPVGAGRSS